MRRDLGSSTTDALSERYAEYLAGLLRGDRGNCARIIQRLLDEGTDLRVLYEHFLRQSLYEVGQRWEQGLISVATEHLATAITESMLGLIYPALFARPRGTRSAVVASAPGETHRIGARMVADFFELNGWRGYFLALDLPSSDLLGLLREKRPNALALSLAIRQHIPALAGIITTVRSEFPSLPVLVGGQAFRGNDRTSIEKLPEACYLDSLDALQTWMDSHPDPKAP